MSREVVNEGNSTAHSYLDGRIRAFRSQEKLGNEARASWDVYLDGAFVGTYKWLEGVEGFVRGYLEGVADACNKVSSDPEDR